MIPTLRRHETMLVDGTGTCPGSSSGSSSGSGNGAVRGAGTGARGIATLSLEQLEDRERAWMDAMRMSQKGASASA